MAAHVFPNVAKSDGVAGGSRELSVSADAA
jgi:hypothetical protein